VVGVTARAGGQWSGWASLEDLFIEAVGGVAGGHEAGGAMVGRKAAAVTA
jgi:hypothetical protein